MKRRKIYPLSLYKYWIPRTLLAITPKKSYVKLKKKAHAYYQNGLSNYLFNNQINLFKSLSHIEINKSDKEDFSQSPIFIFWCQGNEDKMPSAVKFCFDSVKAHATSHPVILITKDNFSNYVEIPSYITSKVNLGKITLMQFSDIMRMSLLAKYGGLWLDATVWCKEDIPEDYFSYPLFTVQASEWPTSYQFLGTGKWCGFILGGNCKDFFGCIRNLFFDYWKQDNVLIDYFLIDLYLYTAYSRYDKAKKLIDSAPKSNHDVLTLARHLHDKVDKEGYQIFVNSLGSVFNKLNWRINIQDFNAPELGYYLFNEDKI